VNQERSTSSPLQFWPGITLNIGFALTGFSTVLLGCLLPALSMIWHTNDGHAGRLLAAQFAGAALGALLPGADFQRSALQGYLLVIGAAVALAFTGGLASTTFLLQCSLLFSFGLGLGWAMTSTSLLVGTLFRRTRGSALSLLNASWTIGAAACPFVATQWTRHYSPASIFLPLSIVFSVCLLAIFATTRGRVTERSGLARSPVSGTIWTLIILPGSHFCM
jgi:FHS family glucose/mannose:H+ symporter-like MFS transporter